MQWRRDTNVVSFDQSWVRSRAFALGMGVLSLAFLLCPARAIAQPPPGSQLPNPRLYTVFPPGAKIGTVVEVGFTGTDLEDPRGLLFSHPGIKAVAVPPPAPPKPDPKKPAPPPMPPPAITKFKVTVASTTPMGIYDVRIVGKFGVSNPRAFVIGDVPEVIEKEPNDEIEQAQRVTLNATINGALASPVDVDYFVFAGKRGQRVVVSCLASSIDSRLQPALELFAKNGRRLAYNTHYQDNDALVDATLPDDGDYFIRLHQFTYTQGDAEYFYRLTISTAPWIDAIFPPVVEPGKPAHLTIYGRNLPGGKLDPSAIVDGQVLEKAMVAMPVPGDLASLSKLAYSGHLSPALSALDGFEYRLRNGAGLSNPYLLTYGRAPVTVENGAHSSPEQAQEVLIPCEIAGRIEKKGDRDWYVFAAKKGEVLGIEVFSERLGVKSDMYFTLRNAATKQNLGEFDDNPDTLNASKFYTYTEDPPRHPFVVPADGKYQLLVSSRDAGTRAGPRKLYRVSITREQPDFRLIVMAADDYQPDSCRLFAGAQENFTVMAWRLDGFQGPITVTATGLPPAVTCSPQTMGRGMRQIPLVLSAAPNAPATEASITIKGTAVINGRTVIREARPASITWPVAQAQNIPTLSRLDRGLVVAVREKPPYRLSATIDKPALIQGDKAILSVKVGRLWPDFKTPLLVIIMDVPPNMTVNNNQPIEIAAGKDSVSLPVQINPPMEPGVYSLVLRTSAQIPFTKDPKAKEKPAINVVLPSNPIALTVLPKQVASVAVTTPLVTAKAGTQNEVLVKLSRMHDFGGEFKVKLVLPPNIQGLAADVVTIPPGKTEAKLTLRIAPGIPPGNRADLIVRATALQHGTVATDHDVRFSVNVIK